MSIRELTIDEFNAFVRNSPLGTHYQTFNYALLMGENGYEYELVGMFNEYNQLKAASLILFKNLKMHYKYGYAPKGFILDYFNQEIVSEFATLLKSYYKKKKVVFIKINPEIAISEIDKESGLKTYNWNYNILEIMEKAGFKKLKDNLYFESVLPRFSAVVSLKNYSMNSVSKNTRNKIRRAHHKGLHIELAEKSGIDILQKFIKNKRTINEYYYKDYYNVFNALIAIAVGLELDISLEDIKKGIKKYKGASRRLEYKGKFKGACVYDDYGHHPTEIMATSNAIHKKQYNESWVIFEAHTYSRAYKHKVDFAKALKNFDHIIVTDIYAAREENVYGITEDDIVKAIKKYGKEAFYISNYDDIKTYLSEYVNKGDLILTLGAGYVTKLADLLVNKENE